MENKKAYFVDTETEELYELNAYNTKRLEKKFPNWNTYNCYNNNENLFLVFDFFKKYGKLVGHAKFKNLFVGLTVE